MKDTQWQPSGETMDQVKRELGRAIRSKLPPIEMREQPNWAFGIFTEPSGPLVAHELLVQLKTLTWRMLESIDWQKRASFRSVFSGQAWVNGELIDFTGDHVRDLATGAFLEFQMLTMGL